MEKLGIDPSTIPWWAWFLFGGAFWFAVQNFVLPDPWSIWLAVRRNGLTILLPFAALAFLIGFGNLAVASVIAFVAAFKQIIIAPWVWWSLLAGIFVLDLYLLVWRRHNRPIVRRK